MTDITERLRQYGVGLNELLGRLTGVTMETVRIHISKLYELAVAEGIDRFFKTPRGVVGGFEESTLARMELPRNVRLLPMRGERWPEAAIQRAQQIAVETYRSMVRPNTGNEPRR